MIPDHKEDLKNAIIQTVAALMNQGMSFEEAKKKITEDLEKSLFSNVSDKEEEKP